MEIHNLLNEIRFTLRTQVWGKVRFRHGLPEVIPTRPEIKKECDFYSLVLSRGFSPADAQKMGLVVDVGCRNWSYVGALSRFFPNADLLGVELDGLKRYRNLFRRIDYAEAFAEKGLDVRNARPGREIRVVALDFLEIRELRQKESRELSGGGPLFCFFFPFVSEDPCLAWGLPKQYGNFGELLDHAVDSSLELCREPLFLSLHQGPWEAEIARGLYLERGIEITHEEILPVESFQHLWPGKYEICLFRCRYQKE